MADVKGPLFSLGAKGSIKKTLTYQKTSGGYKVYKHTKPGDRSPFTPSADQRDKRMLYNLIVARWQTMGAIAQKVYNDEVANQGLSMSGWNLFYKKCLSDLPRYLGLQGYWSMNKIVAGEVLDLSGNDNNMTLQPNYPSDSPTLVDSFNKKLGSAGKFNGTTQYMNASDDPSLRVNGAFMIESLVKVSALKDYNDIFSKGAGANTNYILRIRSTGKIDFFVYDTGGTARGIINVANDIPMVANKKFYLACGYDGTTFRIFVNGVQDSHTLDWSGNIINTVANLNIGFRTDKYSGVVDEVRFWKRYLPLTEIIKHARMYNLYK